MNVRDVMALLRPVRTKVANLISRAVVNLVDDSLQVQMQQITLLADETREEIERFQNYGFTSVPKESAEAVVVFPGGSRDHGIVIVVDDRRYRLKDLGAGEVAVYNDTGSKIVLRANGDIEVVPDSGKTKVTGDLDVSGTVTAITDVLGGGKSLKNHLHPAGALVTGASAGQPVTGVTGAPS